MKYTAEGGSLAEEAISTIRTAQAFGTQITLAGLYDLCVAKSLNIEMKAALASGFGLGSLFFVIYSAYALGNFFFLFWNPDVADHLSPSAFSFGTTLIDRGDGQSILTFFDLDLVLILPLLI